MGLRLANRLRAYLAFGYTIASNLPLDPWLTCAPDSCIDLVIHGKTCNRLLAPALPPIVDSQPGYSRKIYRASKRLYFYIPNLAGFFIGPRAIRVYILSGGNLAGVIAYLLSTILALWLELQGRRVLHASGIGWRDKTILFMADSTTGKSTLTAYFLQQGASLLSDDLVPIVETPEGFFATPGYPALRLSEDQKDLFVAGAKIAVHRFHGLDKILVPVGDGNWGSFCNQPQKIDRIYLLDRQPEKSMGENETSFANLSKVEAVLALIRYSFTPRSPIPLGTAAERMAFFARLVGQVPVTRLTYPSGYEYLPVVLDAVSQNLI